MEGGERVRRLQLQLPTGQCMTPTNNYLLITSNPNTIIDTHMRREAMARGSSLCCIEKRPTPSHLTTPFPSRFLCTLRMVKAF